MRVRPLRILCLLVGSALASQDTRTTIGRFVDLDGAPVAGATITFATSPPRVFDAFRPTALTTAVTDADGRYRVSLRTGRAYSAWAIGPDAAGDRARSTVREGVITGNIVDFTAAPRTAAVGRVQFAQEDLAALAVEPLFAVVRFDALHHLPYRVPLRGDGTLELPPLPFADLKVHLTDAAGAVVVPHVLTHGGNAAFAQLQTRQFVVRDEAGRPLPDAIVTLAQPVFFGRGADPFGTLRVEANTLRSRPTDADGRTDLRVPKGKGMFLASAPGFAAAATGAENGTWFQDGRWTEDPVPDAAHEVTFTLRRAPALRGRLHRGERALADLGVEVSTDLRFVTSAAGGTQSISLDHADRTRTDADGNFEFASVPQNASGLQFALQPIDDNAPPLLLLPRETVATTPLDLDVATWPVVTFRGTTCSGGPAGDLRLLLLPGHTRIASPDTVSLPADRAGRVHAQLEPGTWFVFATDGDGAWAEVVTVPAGDAREIAVPLAPLARTVGTLQDGDGRPIVGVDFRFSGMQATPVPPDAPLRDLLLRHHAMMLVRGLTARACTDANGRFELRHLVVPGVTLIGSPSNHYGCRIELREGAPDELLLRSRT